MRRSIAFSFALAEAALEVAPGHVLVGDVVGDALGHHTRVGGGPIVDLIAQYEDQRRAERGHTQQAEDAELSQQAEVGHAISHSHA